MANDTFDRLFNDIGDEQENAGYYADSAMQYLTNIDELEGRLGECHQKVRMNQQIIAEKYELERDYENTINSLKQTLKVKNQEINRLRLAIRSKNRGRVMNPEELEVKMNTFLSQCTRDAENYKRTGRFNNLETSINKVREFFNIFLAELNELNSGNRNVLGVLDTLIRLEVKFLFNLNLSHFLLFKINNFISTAL